MNALSGASRQPKGRLIAAVKMQEQNKDMIILDVVYSEAISHNNSERF